MKKNSGYTLIDLIVVMTGVVPAIWVSSYFTGVWRTVMFYGSTFVFGIAFWCFLFLWLVPLLERRRKIPRRH